MPRNKNFFLTFVSANWLQSQKNQYSSYSTEYFFLEKNSSFSTRKRVISVPFVLFASNYFLFSFRNFSPSYKFPPLQKIFLLRNNRSNEGGRVGSMELSATSTWLIFEIRRWREERVLVRKGNIQEGNMCKIIRNCSRRCRLNPISPVSISSHRAGYSPFRRITLPFPLITPSNLYPLPLCSTCAHLLNNTPADYRPRLYLAVRANHRRLTAAL